MKSKNALSCNDAIALGSAVVSTAVFGVPPETLPPWESVPLGVGSILARLAGETPARATGTVALPNPTASLRLGGLFLAVVLQWGVLAASAQTNIYLYTGSETNITLNPGTYIITAYGAMGGTLNRKLYGGLGAEMSAEFNFSTSTALTLLVGGGGGISSAYYGGSGGGGSFVVEGSTPLVIAGGGGGGGDLFEGANGNVSANGGSSTFFPVGSPAPGSQVGNSGFGGTNGGGGAGGFTLYYGPGSTISLSGGGGGGFLGNGGGGDTGDVVITNGGGSFESGGYGGSAGSGYSCAGGYGGGGGGGGAFGGGGGGGGGGYSGGGGGNVYGNTGGGGGGGSIIDSSAITSLADVSGIASPDDPTNGEIIITAVPTPVAIITSAALGFTNGMFGFNVIGPSGSNVVIQASTDLQTWIPLQTNLLASGPLHFSDTNARANAWRFYRALGRAGGAFIVGGTLTGLPAGDTITLQDNGSDNLTLSNNGTFTFPTALPNGQSYSVTASGTSGATSIQQAIDWPPVTANCSGIISGANVTNVAVQCMPLYTGNPDVDMYNAAVADDTANGGVPGVMLTESGGPFRVTALGPCSDNVALIYTDWCWFDQVVGSNSCSSTTFPTDTWVIAFGYPLECGFGPYGY